MMKSPFSYVFRCALVAALGGFLFGFDTVVISGAEQSIQSLWSLSPTLHGLAISMALWGTVLGSLFGAYPTEKFGRKRTLEMIGILYLVSAVGSGLAPEVYSFMFFRFIGGIAVGVSTVAAPLYISEIAPPEKRGRLTGMFQFNIVFGILVAFLSNALLANIGDNAWRWMLAIEGLPAIAYLIFSLGIPESPRWLITRIQEKTKAREILKNVEPDISETALDGKIAEIEQAAQATANKGSFWSKPLFRPISLAFLIAFFNQLSGINAILYFAPRIFELTGLGEKTALLQSAGIGVTNLIFTFVGLWLIDRIGRRTLMFVGSIGYISSLGLCSWAFASETFSIVPACIFAFIAAHAIGQGAVIWVFISEIFPPSHRAEGQGLGSFTHWFFAAALTLVFPYVVTAFAAWQVFLFFAVMMGLQLLWVKLQMPETKGVPLESLFSKLTRETK
jgi:SP family arabinose:H+ symporter-like MFS transporter